MSTAAASRSGWPNPWSAARARVRGWFESRLPRTDTLLLTQRNVYILPTPAGLMFAMTLVVLLLASINYQLNLGYVLTFLLAGSGLVSMHVTHNTLRGLTLHLRPVGPVFAREPAALEVVLTSPSSLRYGIGLRVAAGGTHSESASRPAGGSAGRESAWGYLNVPAGGQAVAHLSFVPERRGWHEVPTLSAETRFPLGLFRAWTVWRPAARVLAYPAPEQPAAPLPAARPTPGGPQRARSADGSEFEGVRGYRRGDPLKLVYWKKAAKTLEAGGDLVSRDTSSSVQQQLWLEWQACGALAPEERLSRLSAWTLAAQHANVEYGLRLPGQDIEPAEGEAQQRRVLEALALWR